MELILCKIYNLLAYESKQNIFNFNHIDKTKKKKRLLRLNSYTNIFITVSGAIKRHTNISET